MSKKLIKKISILFFGVFLIFLNFQNKAEASQNIEKAKVLNVLSSEEEMILDDFSSPTQTIEVKILTGENEGQIVSFENDYVQLKKGDSFLLKK